MLVVMKHAATQEQVQGVVSATEELGYRARPTPGARSLTLDRRVGRLSTFATAS